MIASDDASFGLPEIDRGALGAATHLMRLFGMQKTRRMLYTGEPISAQEALRFGGVESVVPRDQLRAAARELAKGSAVQDWNQATNLVITDQAAGQIMGDWAQGEFQVANEVAGTDYTCLPGLGVGPQAKVVRAFSTSS